MAPPAEAPAWVLLRGLIREARHWGSFADRVAATWPDCRVICPDIAGNGRRNRERSPASVDAMVEDCRTSLRSAGVAPPYRLLALSMGGMMATRWAQRHPGEITGLVLINTSMRPYSPFHARLRPGNYPGLLALMLTPDAAEREAAVLSMVSNHPQRRAAALPAWTALAQEFPVTGRNALRQLVAAARFHAGPAGATPPALVLASEHDRLVDAACSRAIALAWNVPLALHPEAGHDLPLDDPAWVIEQVRKRFAATGAA